MSSLSDLIATTKQNQESLAEIFLGSRIHTKGPATANRSFMTWVKVWTV